ncbi:double-stranded RNA-binding protein 1-like isoform X5 [Prunus dulcis]|uniref:double-stranded RNA-binding protein 1-like isoform X5 n=1 Tax=Prunus dulcis TaxID=3755 RepID=UPI00148360F3|nr:double-stranded RNA-binding protein 1-like isoform X5 [Prunus dulcis]
MYKSKLQELCQQRKWRLPEYNATKLGLDHNPRFSASVTINGVAFDTVQLFRSSKEAQNDAARLAFAHFTDPQPRHTNRIPSPSSFPQPSLPASSALPSTAGTNLTGTHDTKQTLQPKIQETHETSYVPVEFSGIASGGNSQANGSTSGIEDALPSTAGTNLTGTHDTKQTLQPKIQETHETSYVPVEFSGIASGGNSQANGSTLGIEDGNRLRALPSTASTNLTGTHDTKQTLQPKIQETHETSYVPVEFSGIASGGNSQASGSTLDIEDGNRLRALPSTVGTILTGTHDTKQTLQPKIQETHETSYVPVEFSGIASGGNSQANGSTLDIEDGNRLRDIQHLYKNQLQTYAHKRNLLLPVYSCEREGPPHANHFKCRVTIDEHTYEGQEFLPTMKEAEHAVAKVALMSLLPNGIQEDYIGLYKNVLQELIQKEGFSMPVYSTKNSGEVHVPIFVSTVEIEGETFTGSEARSKKQAEMGAAKVAYHTLRERKSKSSKIPLVRPPAQKGLEMPEILSSSFQSNLATDLQEGRPNTPMIVSPSAITREQMMENSVTAEGNSHHPATVSSRPDALTTSSGFSSSDVLYGRAQESNSSSLSESRNGSSSTLPSDTSTKLAMDSTLEPPAKRSMYNKVSVYPYKSDMKFPEGNTVLPTSDEKWVALSHT